MGDIEYVDVAVVGAGAAGCYAAYRLLEARHHALPAHSPLRPLLAGHERLTVSLYEQDERVGGRLKSVVTAGGVAELGAMRFHYRHRLVRQLLAYFRLDAAVAGFEQDRAENLVGLRGQQLRRRDLARLPLPYCLPAHEQGARPDDLLDRAIEQALPGFAQLRHQYHACLQARQWPAARQLAARYRQRCQAARLGRQPLARATWASLLHASLSAEARALVQDSDGYETLESAGGAAGWLDMLFHIPPGVGWQCLPGGFAALARALHGAYAAGGGQTHGSHHLRAVHCSPDGNGPYTLEFACPAGLRRVQARLVLLSLPKPALARLNHGRLLAQLPAVGARLTALSSVDACKVFLVYPRAWWQPQGLAAGRSTTDLPLRQVYYYPPPPTADGALLLAAYCNGPDVAFWQRLRAQPSALGQMAHALLRQLHRAPAAPPPVAVHAQFWLAAEGRPGWHVRRQGLHWPQPPAGPEHLYFIGEGWSREPGSVEGALRSAEQVLTRHLQLPPPPWPTLPAPSPYFLPNSP